MTSLRRRAATFLASDRLWIVAAGAAFALLVFFSQNRVVGWEPGYNDLQPGHHGWVSSHTLAVIAHATPANGFVGFALATIDEGGRLDFDYFDRYPVFFSAGMHALLSLKTRLSTQIFLAKQAMNGFFILAVGAAYLILRKLSAAPLPALASSILAVSSPYLLFYKDMVHYDQPALLGMLLLILAIAHHKLDGRRGYVVYGAALIATGLGRGYASLVVLLVWCLLEAIAWLRQEGASLRKLIPGLISLPAARALALGTGWAALNLGYNISVEVAKRGVPAAQTSIVLSAVDRLALNQDFNASYAGLLGWGYFVRDELIRLVRWSFPVWNYEGSWQLSALIVGLMVGVIFLFGRSRDRAGRQVIALLTLSGPIWLFAMRNLSAFHDYTAMYFLGIPLVFYAAIASTARLPRLGWLAAVGLSLVVFAARNAQIQNLHREIGGATSAYTHDFMRIAAALPSEGQAIFYANGVQYAPYAAGFYLPDQYVAARQVAEYSISSDPDYAETNLTPENSRLFLFKND